MLYWSHQEAMMMTFGQRLRLARERRGLKVRQLAANIDKDPSYISMLENDHVGNPGAQILDALAKALDVSIDWLWTGNESQTVWTDC
jgi:transcriptional regulator with XRE-family HTH domain